MNATLVETAECTDWVLNLASVATRGVAAGISNGKIRLLSEGLAHGSEEFDAHSGAVNRIRSIDGNTIVSCSNDGTVKVWDLRSNPYKAVAEMSNRRKLPFLSLDNSYQGSSLIASGTELEGVDAELLLWDLRDTSKTYKQLVDSHHDDITEVRFHPTRTDLLLSGSTDNYVNIYDLKVEDEDDAQLQVINFQSIHSANFLSDHRVYTLSHMETFACHELVDLSTEESVEPAPTEYGDVRKIWDCEYVTDIYAPGYIGCGSNSEGTFKLYQFDPLKENFGKLGSPVLFPRAHGEEVVRDLVVYNGHVYTGGEDGLVKCWQPPAAANLGDTQHSYFQPEDATMEAEEPEEPKKEEKPDKREDQKKHKHHGNKDKSKKHKHKHKHHHHYKPY